MAISQQLNIQSIMTFTVKTFLNTRQDTWNTDALYLQFWWYIALLPTLISFCTHILDTARSVTETKKNKTLANKIFVCRCVGVTMCNGVCFNFLLSLKTFAFTCVHLKFFLSSTARSNAQHSQGISRMMPLSKIFSLSIFFFSIIYNKLFRKI